MSEDVVADFTSRFCIPSSDDIEPVNGRVIMTKRRLVVASAEDKTTVPLSNVVDVNVGSVPNHVKQFFDKTVTLGYKTPNGVKSVVIEHDSNTLDTFVAILFRCILNGQQLAIKHPARVGGRVKDSPVVTGTLAIKKRSIEVKTGSKAISIDIESVMNMGRSEQLKGRPTLVVKWIDDSGMTNTSLLAPAKKQFVNILARFLRLEFDELRKEVAEVELSDPEKRILVAIHATGGQIDLASVLDGDPAYATNVLNSVKNKDLAIDNANGVSLTPKGRIVVSQRLEDINI